MTNGASCPMEDWKDTFGVMGTYGKTGVKKLLMVSSTEKVIGSAGCAVLVVKAEQAVENLLAQAKATRLSDSTELVEVSPKSCDHQIASH